MSNLKISYLITCKDELTETKRLLSILQPTLDGNDDEIVIVCDALANSDRDRTTPGGKMIDYLWNNFNHISDHFDPNKPDRIKYDLFSLSGDFSRFKNHGNGLCSGDFIFQCDADEYPTTDLLENLKALITSNPEVELFRLPRVNLVHGLTQEHASKWGWQVYWLDEYPNVPCVNKNDNQGRLYKNVPDRIKWVHPVHEVIVGHTGVTTIPFDPEFALIHEKTIDRQEKQNSLYSKMLTL